MNMKLIENKNFDQERALYGSNNLKVVNCSFEGENDGESALKECKNIFVDNSLFDLRYPFWHNDILTITNSKLTINCRAALWYCNDINIDSSKLHGIKAIRECSNINITNSDISSSEFGWFSKNIQITKSSITSEYCLLKSEKIHLKNVHFNGKYSFQYIKNAIFEDCEFNTKDAFWHGEDIIVRNSIVKGEYLAWYSNNITFENCTIIGTQPLCYCKNLKLINCKMIDTDLSFEKSEVEADIISDIISVKNPISGYINALDINEIILEEPTTCIINKTTK